MAQQVIETAVEYTAQEVSDWMTERFAKGDIQSEKELIEAYNNVHYRSSLGQGKFRFLPPHHMQKRIRECARLVCNPAPKEWYSDLP